MRWLNLSLPLVSFVVTAGTQMVIPRILQMRMSAAEYSAFVLVSSTAGYIGLADGGMGLPLLRELTAHHGQGRLSVYVSELRRANRVYAFAAIVGLLVTLVALDASCPALGRVWRPATGLPFLGAAAAVLGATALRFWSTMLQGALLMSRGKYAVAQILVVLNALLPALALGTALVVSRDLTRSLLVFAAVIALQALVQGVDAWKQWRAEFASIVPGTPPRRLGAILSEGLAIKTADSIVVFGLPHALTIVGVALVPAAIPARTLANSCRLIGQQFLSILEVRITRQSAVASDRRSGFSEFKVAAGLLSSFHIVLVGVADLSSRALFELWLPNLSDGIRQFLPGLMADQVLLSAILPSSMLFVSQGKLRPWGLAKLAGSLFGVAALLVLVDRAPAASFGIAHLVTTIPSFALCMAAEFKASFGFPQPTNRTKYRYYQSLVVAGSYLLYPILPWLAPSLAVLLGVPLLAVSTHDAIVHFRRA